MALIAQDILDQAAMEIGALGIGETLPAAESTYALAQLNRLFDSWGPQAQYIYTVNFFQKDEASTALLLSPNNQSRTIGPTGNYVFAQRPVLIKAANLVLNNVTPNVLLPLNIRDDDWWADLRVRAILTSIPTDLYYSPDFPNGTIYFWPEPNTAYGLELELWFYLAQIAATTTAFSMPPGDREAVTLTLAEMLAKPYGKTVTPELEKAARKARGAIITPNLPSPRLNTNDAMLPQSRGGRGSQLNWHDGSIIR